MAPFSQERARMNDIYDLQDQEKKRKLSEIYAGIAPAETQDTEFVEQTPAKSPKEVNKEVNKAIVNSNVNITPEEKKFVKANWAEYDKNIGEARTKADKSNKLLSILEAANKFFTAGTGVQPDSAFYDKLRKENVSDVDAAKESKMSAISEYYKNADAERAFNADKRQGEMDIENKRRWEVDDQWRREKDKEDKAWREKEAALNRQNRLEDRQLAMTRALQEKAEKKELADAEKKETLGINYGGGTMMAKTADDAKVLKEGIVGADAAIADLKDVRQLGKNVSIFDRTRVNLIQQKLMTAVGKLRLSVLGPGVMTEAERAYLKENIGDPTILFSTEGIQDAKLEQLIKQIEDSKDREINIRTRQSENVVQPKQEVPKAEETVNIQAPNGSVRRIPKSKANAAIQAGGKIVE